MCIRKVLYCYVCRQYETLIELTEDDSDKVVTVVYEVPCGMSYCDCFNTVFDFLPRSFDPKELLVGCTPQCDKRKCYIDTVLHSCVDDWTVYRVVSVRMHRRS